MATETVTVRIDIRYGGRGTADRPTRHPVPLGAEVTLVVLGDPPEELHLRGYEQYSAPPRDGAASLTFRADVPGIFAVEADRTGERVTEIEVRDPAGEG